MVEIIMKWGAVEIQLTETSKGKYEIIAINRI